MESEYRPGNRDDFDRLYRETYSRVRYMLLGMLRDDAAAEDCAQDAFVKAFRAWSTYRGDAPAQAWVHRIAINEAMSHRRRDRLRSVIDTLLRAGHRPHHDPADNTVELLEALRALPPREAAAIVLRFHHGYSNREIAAALGIPESTVASRLAAAKRRLEPLLGGVPLGELSAVNR